MRREDLLIRVAFPSVRNGDKLGLGRKNADEDDDEAVLVDEGILINVDVDVNSSDADLLLMGELELSCNELVGLALTVD